MAICKSQLTCCVAQKLEPCLDNALPICRHLWSRAATAYVAGTPATGSSGLVRGTIPGARAAQRILHQHVKAVRGTVLCIVDIHMLATAPAAREIWYRASSGCHLLTMSSPCIKSCTERSRICRAVCYGALLDLLAQLCRPSSQWSRASLKFKLLTISSALCSTTIHTKLCRAVYCWTCWRNCADSVAIQPEQALDLILICSQDLMCPI